MSATREGVIREIRYSEGRPVAAGETLIVRPIPCHAKTPKEAKAHAKVRNGVSS